MKTDVLLATIRDHRNPISFSTHFITLPYLLQQTCLEYDIAFPFMIFSTYIIFLVTGGENCSYRLHIYQPGLAAWSHCSLSMATQS